MGRAHPKPYTHTHTHPKPQTYIPRSLSPTPIRSTLPTKAHFRGPVETLTPSPPLITLPQASLAALRAQCPDRDLVETLTLSLPLLQASLAALRAQCPDRDLVETFTMLATRPMQLALYFCTGQMEDVIGWR